MPGLVVVAIVAVAGLFSFAIWRRAKRRKALAAWAASNGLAFQITKDRAFGNRFPAFGCLHRGHSRYATNVAKGAWNGRHLLAFDYRYVTGSGKSQQTHRFSAIILQSGVSLKPLRIRPEGIFDRVTEFLGLDDIDFESAEFSRSFHVKSQDRRWAYDVLHPRAMEYLLSMPRFSIQFNRHNVMVWRNGRFDPETFETAISIAERLLDSLPGYVLHQQQELSRRQA